MTRTNLHRLAALLGFVLPILACSLPGSSAEPTETATPDDASVQTAVALTLQAEQISASPAIEASLTTTLTPTIAYTGTPTVPILSVSVNTNCRYGPGIVYDPPVKVFNVGQTAQVLGKDPTGEFYYISDGCWVWGEYATISGDTAGIPVFTPPPTPTYTPTSEAGPWEGTWVTDCGSSGCDEMVLSQEGNNVSGTYANGDGEIQGTISGNHLTGNWYRNNTSGSIDFWLDAGEKSWRGNYNRSYGWCGWRQGQSQPDPCSVSSWYGTWATNCGASVCGNMNLTQDGITVSGTYASGDGSVSGTVDGLVFTGTWYRNNTSGPFTFYMKTNGTQFQGNYNTSFAWCGYRDGAGDPSPCLKN